MSLHLGSCAKTVGDEEEQRRDTRGDQGVYCAQGDRRSEKVASSCLGVENLFPQMAFKFQLQAHGEVA